MGTIRRVSERRVSKDEQLPAGRTQQRQREQQVPTCEFVWISVERGTHEILVSLLLCQVSRRVSYGENSISQAMKKMQGATIFKGEDLFVHIEKSVSIHDIGPKLVESLIFD